LPVPLIYWRDVIPAVVFLFYYRRNRDDFCSSSVVGWLARPRQLHVSLRTSHSESIRACLQN